MNDPLQEALATLRKAYGPEALKAAHASIQRRVREARRKDGDASTLGSIVMEAIVYRDTLRDKGVQQADLDAGLEAVIRGSWPKAQNRTEPWRYLCERCGDTGLRMVTCTPRFRCGGIGTRTDGPGDRAGKYRRLCVGSADYEHDYGVACECVKGDRFREGRARPEEDFTTATKSKPKPMAKWGRG